MKVGRLVTVTLLLSTSLLAQSRNSDDKGFTQVKNEADRKSKDEVLASIRGRLEAIAYRDFEQWASFVADDMLAPREGRIPSKQNLIQMIKGWPPDVKYYYGPLEDLKVRVHGDTAVVSYLAKQYNEIGGQTTFVQSWQMETLMRTATGWKLISVADAPIPRPPVVAKVDPKVYDAFVGQYEWAPTLVATISREGDRLIQQLGSPDKEELLPESEYSFFSKDEAESGGTSRYIFVKDGGGRVTHYIYRELGGTDRIVKKVR
jgi:ketosteroid isomerase-like protein